MLTHDTWNEVFRRLRPVDLVRLAKANKKLHDNVVESSAWKKLAVQNKVGPKLLAKLHRIQQYFDDYTAVDSEHSTAFSFAIMNVQSAMKSVVAPLQPVEFYKPKQSILTYIETHKKDMYVSKAMLDELKALYTEFNNYDQMQPKLFKLKEEQISQPAEEKVTEANSAKLTILPS